MKNIIMDLFVKTLSGNYFYLNYCKIYDILLARLLFFLIGFCIFSNISAQELSLSGRVIDEYGKDIPNAYLIVLDSETSEVLVATASDSNGRFLLRSVPSHFVLNVTHIGYASVNIPVNGETDFETINTIQMQVVATEIDDIVVTADAPRIEREVGKFIMRNISASPFAKGSSTYNFLRFMPMVDIKSEGGISILGKTDAIIRIDGRSIGTNQMAEQMLKGIPASEIARIEIIPLSGSTQAAENRNGIINVVLKKRPDDGVRIIATLEDRLGYYNSPEGVIFMNYAGKKVDLTAGVTTSYNQLKKESDETYDYLQTGVTTLSQFREKTTTFYGSGYANMNYRFNNNHKLGMQISLGSNNYRHNSSSVSTNMVTNSNKVNSVYTADVRTNNPTSNLNLGANINYCFNINSNGSHLSIDIDFKNNSYKRNIYSIYRRDEKSIITDNFLQQPTIDTRVWGGRTMYIHCFTPENKVQIGTSVYRGKVDNDFFFGTYSGGNYVSDIKKTNRFVYKDYNLAGYVNFQRIWSEKLETEVGLRAEKYHANGIQQITSEKVERNEFSFFPSLSLLYTLSDNHIFSFDFTSSIARPYYGQLNPFITYTSPSTYIQNNPYLKSSKGYEMMFTYTLFDDYMLTVDYLYDDDLWTEFLLPSGDMTRKYMDNYGDSHSVDIMLSLSKSLFKSYWNISAEAMMSYVSTRGEVNNQNIDFNDFSYGFTLKSNWTLSKKHKWNIDLKYKYSGKSRAAAFNIGARDEMDIYLTKQFSRASLSLGIYNVLMPNVCIDKILKDYHFTINDKRYATGVVTLSYILGNKQARRVIKHINENIEKRM